MCDLQCVYVCVEQIKTDSSTNTGHGGQLLECLSIISQVWLQEFNKTSQMNGTKRFAQVLLGGQVNSSEEQL